MRFERLLLALALAFSLMGLLGILFILPSRAAPPDLEPGGVVVPLAGRQADLRAAYREPLRHLYAGGRLHRLVTSGVLSGTVVDAPGTAVLPDVAEAGDFYLPPVEEARVFCPTCTQYELAGTLPLSRAYALYPSKIALLRSTVTVPVGLDDGYVMAMWELAHIRQVLDGYLMGAVPYDILTEDQVAANLGDYDMLIIPAFRSDARDQVLAKLQANDALDAIYEFVMAGGTLYAQGSGLEIAEQAGALPDGMVSLAMPLRIVDEDGYDSNQGLLNAMSLDVLSVDAAPLTYSWLDNSLYVLDDPWLYPDADTEVIANLVNVDTGEGMGTAPAVIRRPQGAGQVLGVVGHPTDPTLRSQVPLFMNALLMGMSGRADFYGDAIQTFNADYPAHEFPAYEVVPVSATLVVENLWDASLGAAVVTETLSPGYVLTDTVVPTPTQVLTTADGHTLIIWTLGELVPNARVTLQYQAQTEPDTLAAGIGTFSQGQVTYTDLSGKRVTVQHSPFILTARMAARLVGDRDLEGDRHYRIPADGIYLDMALPLENKEETLASSLWMTDWVMLLSPIVDYENQHVILKTNDGETIWILNEPYLWGDPYPAWEGATASTQTITLEDWRALPKKQWCVFTSTYGIHTDPPPQRRPTVEDYGSFITIPVGYEDVISVTANNELLLPCYPLTWDLGDFPGYWYEEPALRYGVHSRELFGREVRFHGTPREDTVVMPYDAGSVYVAAGTETVPFREYLEAATPYSAQSPTSPMLTWHDVWARPHSMTLRSTFYDVWDWDTCATCDRYREQHAGINLTYGMFADLDGDGIYETLVKEIPTRLAETKLQLLGKTYSATSGDPAYTIPEGQNLVVLPIFKGLGIKIGSEFEDWWHSYRSLGPGHSELISVSEQVAYDHLFFQQEIPDGSWAAFMVSATISTYDFNREGQFKIHDGARLIYRQMHAGLNRYEIYDSHVHVPEGWSSDGMITKQVGPTAVSIYNDTVFFIYQIWDEYDARAFDRFYDPYMKSWGYGDAVWSTYVGGREDKVLFHPVLGPDGKTRVRVAFDNNTGMTIDNLTVTLDLPEGFTAELLYEDPDTAPEPIWPELAFLNRAEVPDAWRSVWYFDLTVGDVDESLWGQVLEIPVSVSGDNLPADYVAPPVRVALQRPGAPVPLYTSGPADSLVLTDALPSEVVLETLAWVTDTEQFEALMLALDADAGDLKADTASEIFARIPSTFTFAQEDGVVTVDLPEALQHLPPAADARFDKGMLTLVGKAKLTRARHGPNVVNAGAGIQYTDPFSMVWSEQASPVTVEAHGASVWVDYYCLGGSEGSDIEGSLDVVANNGRCYIPDYGPAEVTVEVTAHNEGDAIARGVTVTLVLPYGVRLTDAQPPSHTQMMDEEGGGEVTWLLGDLAPGAWKQFTIVMYVEPDEATGWVDEIVYGEALGVAVQSQRVLGIHHTDGEFIDSETEQLVQAQVGGAFWFNVYSPARMAQVYLPVVMRGYDTRPDLLVEALLVDAEDPSNVQVRITNQGLRPASGFWVDLYLDPQAPPEVSQPWPSLSDYGATWQITTTSVAAGESLTLTIEGLFYSAGDSLWLTDAYPAGDHEMWAYVDSWSGQGWVDEADEENNRYGPVPFTVE